MSWANRIGRDKSSSLFKKLFELSIFFSGPIFWHYLVSSSGNSNVDFRKFLNGKFFSWSKFFFLGFGLFPESIENYSN